MKRLAVLLCAAAIAALPARAADDEAALRATAKPARTDVTVGERFVVEVEASGPAGTRWSFPAEIAEEKVDLKLVPPDPAVPAKAGSARYQAAVFAVGDVELPAIRVGWQAPDGTRGEAATAPVALKVGTLLPKNEGERKLEDVSPPVAVKIGTAFWVALIVLATVLATLVVWLVRRRKRGAVGDAAAPEVPAIPADIEALAALDRLAVSELPDRGEFRAFYIELAQVVKRYLERRLDAPILEMTSYELAAFLRAHRVAAPLGVTVRELTSVADQIKFARGATEAAAARTHVGAARAMVADLEARLAAAAAEAAAAVAAAKPAAGGKG